MEAKFVAILESLPPKVPRSRLEPYRELIREMRRRGRTYREIAQVLGERCQVQVAASTVHEFVSRRSRTKPRAVAMLADLAESSQVLKQDSMADQVASPGTVDETSKADVQQRIEALKRKVAPAGEDKKPVFNYDENEPLRVRPNPS